MANFAGRVVLITGASAGLGEGTALHFAKQGAKLALTGREKTRLDDVAKRCSECGIPADNIRTHCGDLTDAAFRKATIEKTVAKFARLDVLVNNAGLVFPGESMGMSEPQYDQTMDLNMKVPFLMSQLAVPHLEKTQGNIVNISSLFGARAPRHCGDTDLRTRGLCPPWQRRRDKEVLGGTSECHPPWQIGHPPRCGWGYWLPCLRRCELCDGTDSVSRWGPKLYLQVKIRVLHSKQRTHHRNSA
ncbi:uncharacterized oxidoreductase TM_0325-like isoform X2 [Haliotis rubra]|uniref:uncharacterized oxidoreductase TM_0325-like isoform X2 n=1 Tax=Haliotis rubra TaxID=36100 RepID=UPI001EE6093B|nr:uncharacterized oxidoreductase TM_0325-like isoform X2 [Haliotis rubra]